MIEFQVFPGTGIVTFGAALTVTAVMHIIDTVAAEAGFRCLLVLVVDMATVTFYFVVLTGEFEIGFIMIETQFGPQHLAMTLGTFLTQAPLMGIVLMALVTLVGRFPVFFILLVANGALQGLVGTLQRKIGKLVLEHATIQSHDIRIPAHVLYMATFAFIAGRRFIQPMITTL